MRCNARTRDHPALAASERFGPRTSLERRGRPRCRGSRDRPGRGRWSDLTSAPARHRAGLAGLPHMLDGRLARHACRWPRSARLLPLLSGLPGDDTSIRREQGSRNGGRIARLHTQRSPRQPAPRQPPRRSELGEGTSEQRVKAGQVRTLAFWESRSGGRDRVLWTPARESPARASTRKQRRTQRARRDGSTSRLGLRGDGRERRPRRSRRARIYANAIVRRGADPGRSERAFRRQVNRRRDDAGVDEAIVQRSDPSRLQVLAGATLAS